MSDNGLQKITTNIYKEDYIMLIDLFGKGWQVQIRDWIHERLTVVRQRTGKVLQDTDKVNFYEGVLGVPGKSMGTGHGGENE